MTEQKSSTVLVVDDSPENLAVFCELLQPYYLVRATTSGSKVLRIAASDPVPDLILLDVMMPDLDGYQVFDQLRHHPATRHIPVIFITAMNTIDAELHGFQAGAVDYITKPIVPPILLARVRTQLELVQAHNRLRDQNAWLEAEVTRRMAENERIQMVAIRALALLAETRDLETGNHILRTQGYVRELARGLVDRGLYTDLLTERGIDLLVRSAPLHDIGKVGIPDAILRKPGPLTRREWSVMKTHSRLGADAIALAQQDADSPLVFLTLAREIAHWHHEKWDGSGYPDKLAGEAIPLAARLMAVADVFDALISARVYKEPFSCEQARSILLDGRGRHFDPQLVEIFDSRFEAFCRIARREVGKEIPPR
ncbi:MAG: response regulator [Magnetococcales bacterium]|nr:response regulator [Magnetococcales bacterium]